MGVVEATLKTWLGAARDAFGALPRSWMAALALLVGSAGLGILHHVIRPLGMMGGFVYAIFHAGVAGTYLYLLETAISQNRRLDWEDVRSSLGTYLWDVISVLFLFFIGSMLLIPLSATPIPIAVYLGVFVIFNPAPEFIYQGHTRSVALLGDAGRFMFDNWPEWLVPQILFAALLFLLLPDLVGVAQMFGPFFGFTDVATDFYGRLLGGSFSLVWLGRTLAALVVVHLVMLFRGFLFSALRTGNRRTRAWKARF